ncbi:MAG: hypothetical protein ACJ74U_02520 [Jatrophihabitantaceae bacterium]
MLRPGKHAPLAARRFVRSICSQQALPARVTDNAAFVAGELVLISVIQSRSVVALAVGLDGTDVILRLRDRSTTWPMRRGLGSVDRGEVVHRLSRSWGFACDGYGREIWAVIGLDPASTNGAQLRAVSSVLASEDAPVSIA